MNLQSINLGNSFQKMKAIEAADHRKEKVIQEYWMIYQRQGMPPYRALQMAHDQYNSIHSKTIKHESNY